MGEGDATEYLDAEDVIALHALVLGCSDEDAANQLRSRQGLEGAVSRPLSHAGYGGADVAMQAAVLAHGIAEGQAFIDGNKRTAWVALRAFLNLNGWDVAIPQEERARWILSLSEGATADELASLIRAALTTRTAEKG